MLALGALVFPCHPNITILYPEKSKINYGSISFVIMILLRKIGTCRIPLRRNDLELAGLEKQRQDSIYVLKRPSQGPFSWEPSKQWTSNSLHLVWVTEEADDNWGRKEGESKIQTSKVWMQLSARGENSIWDSNTPWNNQSARTVMWNAEQTCSEWLKEAKLRLKRSYW